LCIAQEIASMSAMVVIVIPKFNSIFIDNWEKNLCHCEQ